MKAKFFKITAGILPGLFLVLSCATKSQHISFQDYPDSPFFFRYDIGSVDAAVDHVRETEVARQLFATAEIYLQANQNYEIPADKTLLLDFIVTQRSFMEGLDQKNGIYVSCVVRDEDGSIYARETEYVSGKITVLSSLEQNRLMVRIIERIMEAQRFRYTEIQKIFEEQREVAPDKEK